MILNSKANISNIAQEVEEAHCEGRLNEPNKYINHPPLLSTQSLGCMSE